MSIERFPSGGFLVVDLDGAEQAAGPVRSAPKLLRDGAAALARATTYLFASFERRAGGTSGGVDAPADSRSDAVAAFAADLAPLVTDGRFLPLPAKGVRPDDLAALADQQPALATYLAVRDEALAAGVVASARAAVPGGLDGARVVLELHEPASAAIAAGLAAAGARIVAVLRGDDAVGNAGGVDVSGLGSLGGGGLDALGQPRSTAEALAEPADVVVVGSRPGLVDHHVAASLGARALVPSGPLPVTARGLAVLRRADVAVLPDFVTTAAPLLASLPVAGSAEPLAVDAAAAAVADVLAEVAGHDDGPLLGACYRAEAFLATWRDGLPFGRPLA